MTTAERLPHDESAVGEAAEQATETLKNHAVHWLEEAQALRIGETAVQCTIARVFEHIDI